ncbi:tubulin monoglycylase TTLL3-like [Lycorma delicatula]|uniref:tubulin monoglycylase TTLL3-like n=1 Tax=Lycorma delicatula TaxID=130591 RepID=UPI003F517241
MEKSAQQDEKNSENETCDGTATPDTILPLTPCDTNSEDGGIKYRKRRRSTDSKYSQTSVTSSKLKNLKLIVDKAVEHHKTFIIFGKFPSVREALKSRGWIQNCDPHRNYLNYAKHKDDDVLTPVPPNSPRVSITSQSNDSDQSSNDRDAHLISRLLRDAPVNFIWAMGDMIDWKSLSKQTIVSRFPRVYFTTKVGLCNYLQQTHWFSEAGISNTLFPRCYNISTQDDLNAFINDFRLTACLSLINILINAADSNRKEFYSEEGKVPLTAVEFAARRCSEFVSIQEHEDIDQRETEKIWDHQWDQFLTWYYQLAHENSSFVPATDAQKKTLYSCCKCTIEAMSPHWPQIHLDGVTNLWIVKPGAKSRGRGIQVMRKLEDIIGRIGNLQSKDPRYVVQKYIERPFLIYNTKFDIRQWFLVTSAYPLTIWMYKESYLRFCSQLFSLSNMHESIHLSNNAVQCKYKNAKRDQALPDENMWDCYTFKTYLRAIGQADMWDKVIYPGMRESITGTLLAAQEHMEQRKNCFELYGADFMLTEDLVPWLIEINSSPCMSPTTSVTARMCSQCLEDVIKVVVDRRHNKQADTGMFELVYKQQVVPSQPYMGMNLTVRGTKIQRSPKSKRKRRPFNEPEVSLNIQLPSGIKGVIEDLSVELTNNKNVIKPIPAPPPTPPTPEPPPNGSRRDSNCSSDGSSSSSSNSSSTSSSSSSSSSSSTEDETDSEDENNRKHFSNSNSTDRNHRKIQKEMLIKNNQLKEFSDKNDKKMTNGLDIDNTNSETSHHRCLNDIEDKDKQKLIENSQFLKPKQFTLKSQEKSTERLVRGIPPKIIKSEPNKLKKIYETDQKDEMLYDWKQRVDKTRETCEKMLLKLKEFRENDITCKVHRGVIWKADGEMMEEIMKKLQKQPKRKTFMDRLPIVCSRRSSMKTTNISTAFCPSPIPTRYTINNNNIMYNKVKNSLPQIRQKKKLSLMNENLYAVGLQLTCQKISPSPSPREHLLLPMGNEQCHGINLTSISNALAANCM